MFTAEEFKVRTNWKMSYAEYVACCCTRCRSTDRLTVPPQYEIINTKRKFLTGGTEHERTGIDLAVQNRP